MWYKITKKEDEIGIIEDKIIDRERGGIDYTDIDHIMHYFHLGDAVSEVVPFGLTIPLDTIKWKADKLEIKSIYPLDESSTFEFLVHRGLQEKSETFDLCTFAARRGYLDVLKWARAKGYSWTEWTSSTAAANGHFEILKWLHENGCPWNAWVCANAAMYGYFDILKWARENGCPWNIHTTMNAAMFKHYEILDWAIENGCPKNRDIEDIKRHLNKH